MSNELSINEIKTLQLGMLSAIDSFCNKHGIQYFLCYGSLIGAIRHQGYIPWDDDIDIVMKRDDYNYFFSNFNSEGFPDIEAVDIHNNPNYYLPYGKVVNKATSLYEDVTCKCELGVYIDIFPLDNVPLSGTSTLYNKIKIYRDLLNLKLIKVDSDRNISKNLILCIAHLLLKPISIRGLIKKIDELAQSEVDQANTLKLASYMCLIYGDREIWNADYFNHVERLPFENLLVSCPNGYHELLTQVYGDYMKLPPIEKRVTHHGYSVNWREKK